MIGLWDNTDIRWALAFTAWSRGNGRVNQNAGEMPTYPNGTIDATFTNMAAGFGYVFGGAGNGAGLCNFDGANDFVETQDNPAHSNASVSALEIKFKFVKDGGSQFLYSQQDDGDNFMYLALFDSGALSFRFEIGTVSRTTTASTLLLDLTEYTVHAVKNGATLEIYINGVEAAYSLQEAYDLGNKSFTDNIEIGSFGGAASFNDEIYWMAMYNDAISQARITQAAVFGPDMGMMGFDDGAGNMKLVNGVWARRQSIGQRYGQLAGQF